MSYTSVQTWPRRAVVTAGMPYGNKRLHFGHVAGVFVPATGDAVLLTRFDYLTDTPERGHVVQLEVPGRDGLYLKRVIGLPGETVEIKGGTVYIDGTPLDEPYAEPSSEDFASRFMKASISYWATTVL